MTIRRYNRKAALLVALAILAGTTGLVLSRGSQEGRTKTRNFGADRLVAWEALPEVNGAMCEMVPASASEELFASLAQASGSSGAAAQAVGAPPRPSDAAREQVAKRAPVATLKDHNAGYAGITVDPDRNEVIMADENMFSIHVYDRMEHTPPTARMSEPKRLIQGENTFLEFACGVYVDPVT